MADRANKPAQLSTAWKPMWQRWHWLMILMPLQIVALPIKTKALNQTAKQAVKSIKADMPAKFTLRSRWAQKGIRSNNASQDDLMARVYSVALASEAGAWRDVAAFGPRGHSEGSAAF
ncbi:MAG TPA: hypothetical protein VE954_35770 [Oligoflexus sp.]|nr:hypothetical protein [Oligoflexus sp.]HYX38492.1 hypothetical protein [Oligoflexus sp.]